jgi:Spy/CpxP family protein refolding chaperone
MFGIVIGTLCLVALVAVVRRGRYWGYAHGCGPAHGHGMGRPRFMLRKLFMRLGTSPSQEKVIVEAVNELRTQGDKLRSEWRQSKADLAEAIRAEPLDQGKVEGAFARHDGLMAELHKAATDTLAKVHVVLDPEQRRLLASMLEHPHRWSSCSC